MKNIIGNFKKIIYLTLVLLLAGCMAKKPEKYALYYTNVQQVYMQDDYYCLEYMIYLTPNFHHVRMFYRSWENKQWVSLDYDSYLVLPKAVKESPSNIVGVGDELCFNRKDALILVQITGSDKPPNKVGVGIAPTMTDTLNLAMLF